MLNGMASAPQLPPVVEMEVFVLEPDPENNWVALLVLGFTPPSGFKDNEVKAHLGFEDGTASSHIDSDDGILTPWLWG